MAPSGRDGGGGHARTEVDDGQVVAHLVLAEAELASVFCPQHLTRPCIPRRSILPDQIRSGGGVNWDVRRNTTWPESQVRPTTRPHAPYYQYPLI